MLNYVKLQDLLDEYIDHYQELQGFETTKLQMIMADNIDALNKSLSQEQVYIMKTTALEKRRIELLSAEDAKKTLREIIEEMPKGIDKKRITERYELLSKLIFSVKKISDNTGEVVRARMNDIEEFRHEIKNNTYNKEGSKSSVNLGNQTFNKDI